MSGINRRSFITLLGALGQPFPRRRALARAQWVADRRADLLPVPYFHVVFTVPAPIAAIALQNKAVVYDILLKAAAETIRLVWGLSCQAVSEQRIFLS